MVNKYYIAKVDTKSSDPRFVDWNISLKVGAPVHHRTSLVWIEDLKSDADEQEKHWYEMVVDNNVVKTDG